MKLGLQLGYWGAQPPDGRRRADRRGRGPRLRLGLDRRGLRLRRLHAAGLVGRRTSRIQLGTAIVPDVGPHPGGHGHGRADARPPLRRPVRSSASAPRARRWSRAGTASRTRSRWPARASTSTIVRQVLAREAPVTSSTARTTSCRTPVRHDGPRQAAQVDHPPAARRPADLPRRRGPEERRPGRRDRRRLAADLLRRPASTRSTARGSTRASPARAPAARRDDFEVAATWSPSSSTTTSRRRADQVRPCSASTSAAWAPERSTSTPTCSAGWATQDVADQVQELYLDGGKDQATAKVPDDRSTSRTSWATQRGPRPGAAVGGVRRHDPAAQPAYGGRGARGRGAAGLSRVGPTARPDGSSDGSVRREA